MKLHINEDASNHKILYEIYEILRRELNIAHNVFWKGRFLVSMLYNSVKKNRTNFIKKLIESKDLLFRKM